MFHGLCIKEILVNSGSTIVAVVVVLVIAGALLYLVSARRKSSERLHDKLGPEYDRTVQAMGGERKAQTELDQRRKRVDALNIRPLCKRARGLFGQLEGCPIQVCRRTGTGDRRCRPPDYASHADARLSGC